MRINLYKKVLLLILALLLYIKNHRNVILFYIVIKLIFVFKLIKNYLIYHVTNNHWYKNEKIKLQKLIRISM
jgi:hypothetical protein